MNTQLQKYWKQGVATLPVHKDKRPFGVKTWKGGVKEEEAYEGAFGIAMVCGESSGNLECIDFDNPFGDAREVLIEFIQKIKPLYYKHSFPVIATPNGGYHLIYKSAAVQGNLKLAQRGKWSEERDKFVPMTVIETRGEGGYFVAFPTEGYTVLRNNVNKIPTIPASDRDKLIATARTFNKWHEEKREREEEKDRPGDMFNQDTSSVEQMKSSLRNAGWHEVNDRLWRRPDKKESYSATLGAVAPGVFYVFSSNAHPFESGRAYTAFQVVALLDYNGDFSEFARELKEIYSTQKPEKKEFGKMPDAKKDEPQLEELLRKAKIDLTTPVEKPPNAIMIYEFGTASLVKRRMFTLGNFSVLTGKSKSKKTFFTSILLASAVLNGEVNGKISGELPEGKNLVLLFDTEQSDYDAWVTAKRAEILAGTGKSNYIAYDLREYSPMERCQIIDYALDKYQDTVGYVVIDGVADLAKAINDEEEATRVCGLLMRWSKIYRCHITTVIHQNKGDSYATGHLGSSVMKKSECVISVTKDEEMDERSIISCDLIRGTASFKDFEITVDEKGMPIVSDLESNTFNDDLPY